jgi:capsular exopolysaccharide synthesis family protein
VTNQRQENYVAREGSGNDAPTREAREYIGFIWRRRWPIFIAFQIGLVLTLALLASRPTEYRAVATMLRQYRVLESSGTANVGPRDYNGSSMETELRLIRSEVITSRVRAKIGNASVATDSPEKTDLMRIYARSGNPVRAALVANTFADEYIAYRKEQVLAEFEGTIKRLEEQAKDSEDRLADLDARISLLPNDSERKASAIALRVGVIEDIRSHNEVLYRMKIDSSLVTGGIRSVERASVPLTPYSQSRTQMILLGIVAGALLAAVAAALVELFDDRLQSSSDVEKCTDVAILGSVPKVRAWRSADVPQLFAQGDHSLAAGEAYREIRVAVEHMIARTGANIIQVTSPTQQVGKTTTVVNLGMILGWSGKPVTIVDLDIRSPKVCASLQLPDGLPGFCDVVIGNANLDDVIFQSSIGSLSVVPSGHIDADPSEIVTSNESRALLRRLSTMSSPVLVDGGALKPYSDALSICSAADMVILVIRAGRTSARQLETSINSIRSAGGMMAGIVITGATELPRWTRIASGRRPSPTGRAIAPSDPRSLQDITR